MFFDDAGGIVRTLVVGALAYVALLLILRASGKRTLSKMNAFDWIVTVALGSTVATVILNADVALAEGVTALALLVGLQFLVSWLSVRSQTVRSLVRAEPRLLFYEGAFLRDTMRKERVTESEVYQAVRTSGFAEAEAVLAVVIETDGTFSVIARGEHGTHDALQHMRGRVS
jgi:uncharacterized membrane protein YcaP (DUF421 family)